MAATWPNTSSSSATRIASDLAPSTALERLQPDWRGATPDLRIVTTNDGILVIGGLDVSVRREIVMVKRRRDGAPEMGAVKLYFSKGDPLTREARWESTRVAA